MLSDKSLPVIIEARITGANFFEELVESVEESIAVDALFQCTLPQALKYRDIRPRHLGRWEMR